MNKTFPYGPILLFTMHHTSNLHIRHLDFVESVCFRKFDKHGRQVTACYPIQPHLSMRVERAMDYEFVCFYEDCADGRVMRYLLEVDRNSTDDALESFAEDRIEWFLETDMKRPDAHHKKRY